MSTGVLSVNCNEQVSLTFRGSKTTFHHKNMSVKYIPPKPNFYRTTGVCRGIPGFLFFFHPKR